jgi:hypothetical protein
MILSLIISIYNIIHVKLKLLFMKKLNYFLSFIALSGLLFTSCEDENALGPSLEITSGTTVEAAANSTITITWRANAGDANLKSFTIKEGNVPIVDEDFVDWNEYNIPTSDNEAFVGSARVAIGSEGTSFTLTVTDNDGLTETETVTVTIGGTAGGINEFTAVLMGAQTSATGSTLDADAGIVYSITGGAAASHAAAIDILYYYGNTNAATIAAPNDPTVNGTSGDFTWTQSWTVQNPTKLGISALTLSQFNDITDDSYLSTISGLTETKLINLNIGNVIEFITASGKKGALKVTALANGPTGSITIDVKIQE